MGIKAIFFDFDGTLVNSEGFHFNCWNETLSKFNTSLEWDYYVHNYAGIPTPENAEALVEKFSLPIQTGRLTEMMEDIGKQHSEIHVPELMPFAEEVIKFFGNKGLKLAIVTGSPRHDLSSFFSKVDLEKYFDFVVTRDDVGQSKPHPESYEMARQKSGFEKEEIIVFEDTANGTASAADAGLKCFAIQKETSLHYKLLRANSIFSDLQEAKGFVVRNFSF
ncbi:MAG: HAD family phosphatase [Bacteroidota bacterium]